MEWETKRGRKHFGWGMQFEWLSRSHWKVTYDWQSQGGEGLLVTLSKTAGKCLTCSRDSKVACLALTERSISGRGRSCDQGGNWGQGADVVSLVDHFAGLWLCLWMTKATVEGFKQVSDLTYVLTKSLAAVLVIVRRRGRWVRTLGRRQLQ